MSTYNKEYYTKNKEKMRKSQDKWRKENKTKFASYLKKYQKENSEKIRDYVHKYQTAHPHKVLYTSAKQSAIKRNLEFNITEEDIIIPTHCPILGIELTFIRGKGRIQSNASIDRIDSTRGYVKGNIQIISDLANRMKQEATREQLITFATGILNRYQKITTNI